MSYKKKNHIDIHMIYIYQYDFYIILGIWFRYDNNIIMGCPGLEPGTSRME